MSFQIAEAPAPRAGIGVTYTVVEEGAGLADGLMVAQRDTDGRVLLAAKRDGKRPRPTADVRDIGRAIAGGLLDTTGLADAFAPEDAAS